MGFFSWLFAQPNPPLPKVNTILPVAAQQEILNGRLPRLNTDTIFTQKGEHIHYIDKAILLLDKTKGRMSIKIWVGVVPVYSKVIECISAVELPSLLKKL